MDPDHIGEPIERIAAECTAVAAAMIERCESGDHDLSDVVRGLAHLTLLATSALHVQHQILLALKARD